MALDFHDKIVWATEVSTAFDHKVLKEKVADREKQWGTHLRSQLDRLGVAAGWPIRFLVFLRTDAAARLTSTFANENDVTVLCLDRMLAPWEWQDRRQPLSERIKKLKDRELGYSAALAS